MNNHFMSALTGRGIDHIYVVHALRGYEANAAWTSRELRDKLGLEFEFVSDGDLSLLTDSVLAKWFVPDIFSLIGKSMTSCAANHFYCYEKMIRNRDRMALIFEDDPCPLPNFKTDLPRIIDEARQLPGAVHVSLENSTLRFPPRRDLRPGRMLYPATRTRCTGAYLINQAAAQAMLDLLQKEKCSQAIDWWQQHAVEAGALKFYWAHPPIVEQGSHNGKLAGDKKNKGWIQRIRWLFGKFYKTRVLRFLRG